jgi:hypothetical protein
MDIGNFLGNVVSGVANFVDDAVDVIKQFDPVAKIGSAIVDGLGLPPGLAGVAKMGLGFITGDVILAADGGTDLGKQLFKNDGAVTEHQACSGPAQPPPGYAAPVMSPWRAPGELIQQLCGAVHPGISASGNPLANDIGQYRDALHELKANFDTFDSAASLHDGYFTRNDLQAVLANPNAAAELKQAAQFFLSHPEYFNRLEMSVGTASMDGVVGMPDIDRELGRVSADIQKYGLPKPAPQSANCQASTSTSGEPSLSDILGDPNLSLEEKVMMILQRIQEDVEDDIFDATRELSDIQDKKNQASKSSDGDTDETQHQLSQSSDQVQLRLQQLTEKRKQMFDLISNMSSQFNALSQTAIQNLGRA